LGAKREEEEEEEEEIASHTMAIVCLCMNLIFDGYNFANNKIYCQFNLIYTAYGHDCYTVRINRSQHESGCREKRQNSGGESNLEVNQTTRYQFVCNAALIHA
jgi:hypothetical protein